MKNYYFVFTDIFLTDFYGESFRVRFAKGKKMFSGKIWGFEDINQIKFAFKNSLFSVEAGKVFEPRRSHLGLFAVYHFYRFLLQQFSSSLFVFETLRKLMKSSGKSSRKANEMTTMEQQQKLIFAFGRRTNYLLYHWGNFRFLVRLHMPEIFLLNTSGLCEIFAMRLFPCKLFLPCYLFMFLCFFTCAFTHFSSHSLRNSSFFAAVFYALDKGKPTNLFCALRPSPSYISEKWFQFWLEGGEDGKAASVSRTSPLISHHTPYK